MSGCASISRRSLIAGAALLAAMSLAVGAPRPAAAEGAGDPAQFIRAFSDRAIAMLADEGLSADQREQEFRRLLIERFDVPRIGRFVLGRYWRKATSGQRTEYNRLFEDMIVATYSRRLENYAGETLKVGGARQINEKGVAVSSRILRAGGAPIVVEWRLRRGRDSWRIVDVVVEGVSMALTQRSEFKAVVSSSGGRIEGLLAKLREKAAQVKSVAVEANTSTL